MTSQHTTVTSDRVSRRRFLHLVGATGVLAAAPSLTGWARSANAAVPGAALWSDPATWGGTVPGPSTIATISKPIALDVDATVAGVTIAPGGILIFDPAASRTLTSTGNIVVQGMLQMRPASASVVHRVLFSGVNESTFVGGGEVVLASDVGLWVINDGVLDVAGTAKTAWARTTAAVAKGTRVITLDADPVGWRVGDEITITPTLPPTASNHSTAYDTTTIASINGRAITLAGATVNEHPAVSVGRGVTMTPEVLNLTRNVRIEGTPTGRAHVWIMSTMPQAISYTQMRYVGPRKNNQFVLGRYGLHFHMAMGGVNGTLVEGVVVRDAGNHAFVTHASEGVTLRNCVSHNTFEDAYWWDVTDSTDNVTYDRCVASLVQSVKKSPGFYTLTGFSHNSGVGNVATGCVAVGVQSTKNASGFNWPSQGNGSDGVWLFEDCVAHNQSANGVYVWQNTDNVHVVTRFTAYHNGGFGLRHGAYRNPYQYVDAIIYGNRSGSVEVFALSKDNSQMTFSNVLFDQAGYSAYCVQTTNHTQPALAPVLFTGCEFKGFTTAAMAFLATNPGAYPEVFDVVNCTFSGNEFWLASAIKPASLIRVKDPVHGSIALRRMDQAGTLNTKWNARVTPVTF